MSARPRGTGALEVRRTLAGQVIYARFRVAGQQQRHRLGVLRKPGATIGITRREAEAELRRLLATSTARPEREQLTVEAAALRFIEAKREDLKRSTIVDYESVTRCHVKRFFHGVAIDAVDRRLLERWLEHLKVKKLSPKSRVNALTFLSGVFRYAVRQEWVAANPVPLVDKPRVRRSREIRFLSAEQLDAVLRATPSDTAQGRLDRVAILTAARTGPRQGELLALRWRDVDFAASVIRIRRSYVLGEMDDPKSARGSRATPMHQSVASELARLSQSTRWREDDDLVFTLDGRPQDASALRRRYKQIVADAKIGRRVCWHDMRHTFGTSMAAAGAPLRSIMEWMGHANIQTTMIYADYAPDPSGGVAWAERAFASATDPDGTTVARQELLAAT